MKSLLNRCINGNRVCVYTREKFACINGNRVCVYTRDKNLHAIQIGNTIIFKKNISEVFIYLSNL